MEMFGIGMTELLIILVVALLVLGPEELPRAANKLGSMLQQARKIVSETRDTVMQDLATDDEKKAQAAPEVHGHEPIGRADH